MSTPSTPHDDHTRPVSDERRYLARQALARRYGLDPADIQGTSPDQMDRHARILARQQPTGYPPAVVAAYVDYARRHPGQPIPAHWPEAARAASMAAHPAGTGRHPELTAADGTPEKPLPTEHPTDHA